MRAPVNKSRTTPARAPANGRSAEHKAADIKAARRVLDLECQGIAATADALDGALGDALARAVSALATVTGRVVVTGMGKSGLIGRKLAATLASVGTPAFFVHPADASHGDLGMVTPNDAVIALSNSGETAELADIIAFTRRFGITLIGITSRAKSALADRADVKLILPSAAEACPLGLAPTTSTTMMLALGDALAIALLQRKGFSADDFQVLHPGGRLGRVLLRVSDIMHGAEELPLCAAETSMAEALIVMTNKRFGCVGIVDRQGELVGVVTDGDLRRHMNASLLRQPAGDVMTAQPRTIRPQALAAEALGLMNAAAITSLFVVDAGRPLGIIHIHDCLRAGVA